MSVLDLEGIKLKSRSIRVIESWSLGIKDFFVKYKRTAVLNKLDL